MRKFVTGQDFGHVGFRITAVISHDIVPKSGRQTFETTDEPDASTASSEVPVRNPAQIEVLPTDKTSPPSGFVGSGGGVGEPRSGSKRTQKRLVRKRHRRHVSSKDLQNNLFVRDADVTLIEGGYGVVRDEPTSRTRPENTLADATI